MSKKKTSKRTRFPLANKQGPKKERMGKRRLRPNHEWGGWVQLRPREKKKVPRRGKKPAWLLAKGNGEEVEGEPWQGKTRSSRKRVC